MVGCWQTQLPWWSILLLQPLDNFKTGSQPDGEAGDDAFPIPSSSLAESAKDKAIAVATASLPGPGQSTLVCVPPYSGPVPARPDALGQFPLGALVEQIGRAHV